MTGRISPRFTPRPMDTVLRRLRTLGPISEQEQALVRGLGERRERHTPGAELVAEGEAAYRPRFVLSGWACSQRVMPDGRRQIFDFLLPGDGIGLSERPCAPSLCSIVSLTALETVDAEPLLEAAASGRAPGVAAALRRAARQDQARLLDHVVRLGRQTAYERVSHFLLELRRRLEVAGQGDAQRFPMPLTQEMLADALGLSIVHVNRTLQQLRRERLIELRSGVAIILQPDTLGGIAEFGRAPKRALTPV
jgi:CRP-like cAMP-binding protein